MSQTTRKISSVALLVVLAARAFEASAAPCESLTFVQLQRARVDSAQIVQAGQFEVPPPPADVGRFGGGIPDVTDLPAFCRVTATLKPSDDSVIKAEFWLPEDGWNGRFEPTAAGVFLGMINYSRLAAILRSGSVTATSDNGHEGGSASFALGHPERVTDFAHRASHLTIVAGKALIEAFYEQTPTLTLMNECGGGGRAAITEVQRYPGDLDIALVAGLDTHSTHHVFGQMWVWQAMHASDAAYIPVAKLSLLNSAAMEACDAMDGVRDSLIQDPRRCPFDPGDLSCRTSDSADCLTDSQVAAARKIYSPVRNSQTGDYIIGPLMPGSELGWGLQGGEEPFPYAVDFFRYFVFKDPSWDYRQRPVNFSTDVIAADAPENQILNAMNPDIAPFLARGGKLLLIGGWNDTAIAPSTNYDYYDAVLDRLGERAADSVRLFMVPGMGHCPGGNGASTFDIDTLSMLLDWRRTGQAPDQLIAQHRARGARDREILVCAYPRLAVYSGSGNLDDPASYECE